MALFSAVLLNPATRRPRRKKKRTSKRGAKGKRKMAKRRKRGVRRRRNPSAKRAAAARKGWRKRLAHKKRVLKSTRKRSHAKHLIRNPRRRTRRRRRNPIRIGGRRGKFELIPSRAKIMASVQKGAGAVANEMVRGTAYSVIGRVSGSVAEDVLGRLASASLTGMAAGYLFGQRVADAVVEGSYTVTLYKLVADAMAYATKGQAKLFGVLANPFTEVPAKPLIPGMGAAALPAPAGTSGFAGVVPERDVLPLGGVVPETNIVPIGEMDGVPERFRSRF
jgi:hypothetical protein